MKILALFLLLVACTVPPNTPIKEAPPAQETGVAEAPPAPPAPPPKPKPQKPPPPASTAKTEPAPALPTCPVPVDPKKRILQELDCLIKIEEAKPK